MTGYVNHSGGCKGADMAWEVACDAHGVKTIAYSFHNHINESANPYIMTIDELKEGYNQALIADKSLHRQFTRTFPTYEDPLHMYVKNLICRNWFQVKHAESIYAIGTFATKNKTQVNGGTGWAVQMAVDNNKPVFFFDQDSDGWYIYDYSAGEFKRFDGIPVLTTHFAGIGTRDIKDNGLQAILDVMEHTFSPK